MEQKELEVSPPYKERTSVNRKEIRGYKTRSTKSRKAKNLDEVHFEKERANESTPQNIRRRNARENNCR